MITEIRLNIWRVTLQLKLNDKSKKLKRSQVDVLVLVDKDQDVRDAVRNVEQDIINRDHRIKVVKSNYQRVNSDFVLSYDSSVNCLDK